MRELALGGMSDYAWRMEPTVLANNIAALRRHLGDNQEKFANRLGVNQSYISKWEKKGVKPSTEPLVALARLAGWDVEDFTNRTWRPDFVAKGADGSTILIEAKKTVRPDHHPTRNASADDGTVDVISLDLSVSMGPGTLIEDMVEEEPVKWDIGLLRVITRSPFHMLRQIKGVGDSMEPTLRTGDRVLIDTSDRMLSRMHGIYWIDHFGAHGLKRLRAAGNGRVLISSDNKVAGGPDFEVDAEELRIHGRAIWFGREL